MGYDEKYNKIISRRFSNNKISLQTDFVAIESPLEVSLSLLSGEKENVTILMRTPGDDEKLIYGFLLGEGILNVDQLKKSEYKYSDNKINLILNETALPDLSEMKRNFISNSSCGICGKETISEIIKKIPNVNKSIERNIDGVTVQNICSKMRKKQELFLKTGGVHAVGLFTQSGEILCIEEDVGRHNAMDKAIGKVFVIDSNDNEIIGACLSGRASYEMVQKAAMAGIEILICIGAPTSLAIDLAVACSITLVGFVSEKGYNIYTCENRILSTVN
ncbi:MAG: formate dehydrogenase family accessory protein FdhD [Euryarchaeota archaeon]|nr:formate dehydrogenase family accessory protein FdhD [Euryarchaeota archaeon]